MKSPQSSILWNLPKHLQEQVQLPRLNPPTSVLHRLTRLSRHFGGLHHSSGLVGFLVVNEQLNISVKLVVCRQLNLQFSKEIRNSTGTVENRWLSPHRAEKELTEAWVCSVLRYWSGSREQLDSTLEIGCVEDTRATRDRLYGTREAGTDVTWTLGLSPCSLPVGDTAQCHWWSRHDYPTTFDKIDFGQISFFEVRRYSGYDTLVLPFNISFWILKK